MRFDDVQPFALADGVSGRPLFGEGAMLNVIEFEPGDECLRLTNDEVAVEDEQLLHGDGRDDSPLAGEIGIGKVEQPQHAVEHEQHRRDHQCGEKRQRDQPGHVAIDGLHG